MYNKHCRNGKGKIVLECVDDFPSKSQQFGLAQPTTIYCSYPLKFLVPNYTGAGVCRWIFPITFGGGLVGGDMVEIEVDVGDHCCGLLTSQESTKIYHCEGNLESTQVLKCSIGDQALLCVLPDYLVCYKDARYKQTQKFDMSPSGNLVFLDWLTAGRVAREECWEFQSYFNKTEIRVGGELMFRDCLHLHDTPYISMKESMKNYQVTGMCVILGEKLQDICLSLYKEFSSTKQYGDKQNTETIVSISKLEHSIGMSGIYLRFLAVSTTKAHIIINKLVQHLLPLLGSDPYQNKY